MARKPWRIVMAIYWATVGNLLGCLLGAFLFRAIDDSCTDVMLSAENRTVLLSTCLLVFALLGTIVSGAAGWTLGAALEKIREWSPSRGALIAAGTVFIPIAGWFAFTRSWSVATRIVVSAVCVLLSSVLGAVWASFVAKHHTSEESGIR